jgi:predicted DNA binding CopG/RHH family protein
MTEHKQRQSRTKRPKNRIPTFKTIEAAAEFWDTHSLADFKNEIEEVTDIHFVPYQPKKAITLRLPEETAAALAKAAKAKGIGLSALARMWIVERLRGAGPEQR